MRTAMLPPLVVVALLAAPIQAQAATLGVDGSQSCYRAGDTLTVSGSGFTPDGPVDVTFDDQDLGTIVADSAGSFTSPLDVGELRGIGTRTLVATDATDPTLTGTAQFLGSALQVKISPRNGHAGRRLRIRASGFTTGTRLFAHVLRRGYRRNVFIGRLKGPCGTLQVRRKVLPAATPAGKYKVQFDTKRHYARATDVWYRFSVRVTAPKRNPKPEPAPAPPTDCQGYSPCLPPGPDVDCAGGSGDGPRYVDGPVYVTGSDPYDLDRDGDGVACES